MLTLEEGGKPKNPEKNPRSKGKNQKQIQPTFGAGSGNQTRDTLVGGERSHNCANPIPPKLVHQEMEFYSFLFGFPYLFFKLNFVHIILL